MNLVEAQIKQDEEDRKHEEEYAKMEIVLQNNLMRTKVFKEFLFPGPSFVDHGFKMILGLR